jgi:hypothetical protein
VLGGMRFGIVGDSTGAPLRWSLVRISMPIARHNGPMQQRSTHSACNKNGQWAPASSYDQAARRASGRRRYNARRQVRATIRRGRIIKIWEAQSPGGWCITAWGSQSQLAEMLGVSRSTICRDVRAMLASNAVLPCPICDSPLHINRIEELASQGRINLSRRR